MVFLALTTFSQICQKMKEQADVLLVSKERKDCSSSFLKIAFKLAPQHNRVNRDSSASMVKFDLMIISLKTIHQMCFLFEVHFRKIIMIVIYN